MKDRYLPPPFGDSRASWIVNGVHFRDRFDAVYEAREHFKSAIAAEEYIVLLEAEWRELDKSTGR